MIIARRRLMADLKNLKKENPDGVSAQPNSDSIFLWTGVIQGPSESAWEGGIFKIALKFPESYPIDPPTVKFLTQMFHPNIYPDGKVCVDVLQTKWTATSDVLSILISLQVLLACPNPESPANRRAGDLFVRNPNAYEQIVREIACRSASSE
jgi:ubiquitin-protein ligase